MEPNTVANLGAVLGGVAIVLVILSDVVLLAGIFLLHRKVRRLERQAACHGRNQAPMELKGVTVEKSPVTNSNNGIGGNSVPTPSNTRPPSASTSHSSTPSASSSTRKDSHKHQTYDNLVAIIPKDNNPASMPRTRGKTGGIKSLAESGKYTEVVAPLPANLRSEDMLMVPTVTEEQLSKSENLIRDPVDFTAEPPSPTACFPPLQPSDVRDRSNHPSHYVSDYVDPTDARRPSNPLHSADDQTDPNDSVVAWAQLAKMSGKKKRTSPDGDCTPPALRDAHPPNHDDYTEVSDALPEGKFERIGSQKMYMIESRTQPSSETSPRLSARSGESGTAFQESPGRVKSKKVLKTQSLHRTGTPDTTNTSPVAVLKRRSTSDNKEMVCFSPRTGFKLESRNESGGNSPETSSTHRMNSSGDAKPLNSPVQNCKEISGAVLTAAGQHMYAAVDLTAKCRPRDDLVRKEGVGVPEHYVACTN